MALEGGVNFVAGRLPHLLVLLSGSDYLQSRHLRLAENAWKSSWLATARSEIDL